VPERKDEGDAAEHPHGIPEEKAAQREAVDPCQSEGGGAQPRHVTGEEDHQRPARGEEAAQLCPPRGGKEPAQARMGERRVAEVARHQVEDGIGDEHPCVADRQADLPPRDPLAREGAGGEQDRLFGQGEAHRPAQQGEDDGEVASALEKLVHPRESWPLARAFRDRRPGSTGRGLDERSRRTLICS